MFSTIYPQPSGKIVACNGCKTAKTLTAPMNAVRVLHVENDRLVARAVARVLNRLGYNTHSVPSCDAARAIHSEFDVGIFDVDLGDGNGVRLAEELLLRGTVGACLFFTGTGDFRALTRAASNGSVIRKQAGVETLAAELAARSWQFPEGLTSSSSSTTFPAVDPAHAAREPACGTG
jgi:DNA-binding response OmpR family regulator